MYLAEDSHHIHKHARQKSLSAVSKATSRGPQLRIPLKSLSADSESGHPV